MRRNSAPGHFAPAVAVAIVSLFFAGARLSYAEPESAAAEKSQAPIIITIPEKNTQPSAVTERKSAAPAETAAAQTNAETAPEEEAAETRSVSGAEETAQPKVRTTEEITNTALKHWELSQKYYSSWDWKMCELELELAIMELPTMQIAHRDLCVLSFMELNWPRSLAEFMMTVGLGDPIPLSTDEAAKLTRAGMVRHYNKGMEYARKQDWKNTIEELQIAAELAPEDYVVQRSLAFAYASAGDFKTAEACYQRTFDLQPSDGSSRADFAYFLADQGKLGEAQKQLEEAVKSSPDSAAFHVDLCWMAESRGDLSTAAKELKAAVDLSPKHAGLWSHLGRILEQSGDKEKATQAYLKALWLDPQQQDAKEHLAKLQSAES